MNGLAVAALVATIVCVVYARYRLGSVNRDLTHALSPEAERQMDALRLRVAVDAAITNDALTEAFKARAEGDWHEACRMVDLAVGALLRATPERLVQLRGMGVCVRVAAAVLPPPPVPPGRFKLAGVRTLAGGAAVLHHALITPAERMQLRLWVIAAVFRMALRVARKAAAAMKARPESSRHWDRCLAGRADWRSADEEHIASFEMILRSANAAERVPAASR